MTAYDTALAVLGKASLLDQRMPHPDQGIAVAWAEVLGAIDLRDALDVVTAHYRQPGPERIMPGDVLAGVRKLRAERIRADGREPEYDGDDVAAGLAAIKARRRELANGTAEPLHALPAGSNKHPAQLEEMLDPTGRRFRVERRALPRARCMACGDTGWIEPPDESPAVRCDHGRASV